MSEQNKKTKHLYIAGAVVALVILIAFTASSVRMSMRDKARSAVTDIPYETSVDSGVVVDQAWESVTGTFENVNEDGFTLKLSDGGTQDVSITEDTAIECHLIPGETYIVYFSNDGAAALIRSVEE